MSLTSYRAAPPRVKTGENDKRGSAPRVLYVAIMTSLEKAGIRIGSVPGISLRLQNGCTGRSLARHAEPRDEPADELALARENLLPGLFGWEPLRAVDFRK
jgi:hypothetical protein